MCGFRLDCRSIFFDVLYILVTRYRLLLVKRSEALQSFLYLQDFNRFNLLAKSTALLPHLLSLNLAP